MLGASATFIAITVSAVIIGQALLALSGRRHFSWLSAPVGMAALLVVAGVFIRLPGRDTTALVALLAALAISVLYLRRLDGARGSGDAFRIGAPIVLTVAALTALPFAINGNVGVLGAGLVNDDMSSHLQIAAYTADPDSSEPPTFVKGGYPIGPHALVAAAALGTGTGLIEAFAGLTLALAALTAIASLAVFSGFGEARRFIAALMVALAYLGASYLMQGAFKEPLQALIVIGFAILLARSIGAGNDGMGDEVGREVPPVGFGDGPRVHPIFRAAPLGILAAGSVFNYSLPGLIWLGAIAVALLGLALIQPDRPQLPEGWFRRALPYLAGALAIVALATVQEISRIADFARLEALNPDRAGSDLGNLRQAINPIEALGVWPSGEFRVSAADAGLPAPAFYMGGLLAAAVLACGLVDARRRRKLALPAALLAALLIWGLASLFSTPYIAAKALAIAAPLIMIVGMQGLFGPSSGFGRGPGQTGPALRPVVAALFIPAALGSTFLALRQAPVGPEVHAAELERIQPLVQDSEVLFLGRDDFIGWELHGARVTGVVENFFNVEELRGRFSKGEGGGEKFDFDAVLPSVMNQFDFVLTTNGGPLSSPPPRLVPVEVTDNYTLWERTGPVGRRNTLDEGIEPGEVARCPGGERARELRGRGTATVWPQPPIYTREDGWSPDATVEPGAPSTASLELPKGRWKISLEYDSRRALEVRVSGRSLERERSFDVPANLDFRGPTPFFAVGEVELGAPGEIEVEAEPRKANLLARILGAPNEGHLRSLSATPLDEPVVERIQRRQACGAYVDWYRAR